MTRRLRAEAAKVLRMLCQQPGARLVRIDEGGYELSGSERSASRKVKADVIQPLVSAGLLRVTEEGSLTVGGEARAWLTREGSPAAAFRAQHDSLEVLAAKPGQPALRNLDESPVATLARRTARGGAPWLGPDELAAAERLRRDFEMGQLNPRITANWSASVSTGRRAGGDSGLADLTDMAARARLRFNRAIQATGPEFSGLLVDVCCFLKGLELIERERQWPARSAKLVLKLALSSLARHYGLSATASGLGKAHRVHHWGAADYRPEIS